MKEWEGASEVQLEQWRRRSFSFPLRPRPMSNEGTEKRREGEKTISKFNSADTMIKEKEEEEEETFFSLCTLFNL